MDDNKKAVTAVSASGISLFTALIFLLPNEDVFYVLFGLLTVHFLCSALTSAFNAPVPPSRWVPVYNLLNWAALNTGAAANRLQVGKTGILVDYANRGKAKEVLDQAGIRYFSKGNQK